MGRMFGLEVVAVMALLRIAVPIALLALAVRFLRRLDSRWHPSAIA